MNSILLSIQPQWLEKILNGEKTVEVRKSPIKEGTKVYCYCTLAKPYLYEEQGAIVGYSTTHTKNWHETNDNGDSECYSISEVRVLNGLVVCEFIVDKCEKIEHNYDNHGRLYFKVETERHDFDEIEAKELLEACCLTRDELDDYYEKGNEGAYAWHISHLKVYDKPKELKDFYYYKKKWVYSGMDCPPYVDEVKCQVARSPQSFMYVEEIK